MSRSMFGAQPNSKRASAPSLSFASASRDQISKQFFAEEGAQPQRRVFDHRVPSPAPFASRAVTLWSVTNLEQTDRTALRRRAQALQGVLGTENLPTLPHHPASMIQWILHAQVHLSQRMGTPKTLADFGVGHAAPSAEERGEPYFGGAQDKWIKNPDAVRRPSRSELEARPPPVPLSTELITSNRDAYTEAKTGRAASRERNMGGTGVSGIFSM